MQSGSAREELTEACRAARDVRAGGLIERGPLVWFCGTAAAADEGLIALDLQNGAKIILDPEDVVDVVKENEQFLVQVPEGANIVVRFEQATKARAQSCGCDRADAAAPALSPYWAQTICWTEVDYLCWFRVVRGVLVPICMPVFRTHCKSIDFPDGTNNPPMMP